MRIKLAVAISLAITALGGCSSTPAPTTTPTQAPVTITPQGVDRDPIQTIVADKPQGMPRCGAEDGGPVLPCYRERHVDTLWNVFTK